MRNERVHFFISVNCSYDEQYSRRGPYGEFRVRNKDCVFKDRYICFFFIKETPERKWALQDDYWLPERSDHPLEGSPTSWGLIEKKRSQSQCIQRQRTMPNIRY